MVGDRKSQVAARVDGVLRGLTRFEYLHVMIDDHSRLAYAEVLPTLTARCAIAFLRRATAWFAERGIQIKAVMSDNGSAYVAHAYRQALAELGLRHLRIRPYRPRTNGKAERLIQTLLNEWAYERIYGTSEERTAALPLYLERYNFRRPHGSLGHQPPASRLTNVVRNSARASLLGERIETAAERPQRLRLLEREQPPPAALGRPHVDASVDHAAHSLEDLHRLAGAGPLGEHA